MTRVLDSVFPCLFLSRSLGGEKSIHIGEMGNTAHVSFPRTSFEILTFASKGEACLFTLVGKCLFRGGRGEGGGLFPRPPGAVAPWGPRSSSKIHPGPRGCPRDARAFRKAISPLEAATSLVALTKARSELSVRPLPCCACVQWVEHQEAAEFKFRHFPALLFLFLGIA